MKKLEDCTQQELIGLLNDTRQRVLEIMWDAGDAGMLVHMTDAEFEKSKALDYPNNNGRNRQEQINEGLKDLVLKLMDINDYFKEIGLGHTVLPSMNYFPVDYQKLAKGGPKP